MKQIIIILIPVILLGISLAGGFMGNPLDTGVRTADIFSLSDTGDSARDVLQIRSLTAGTITQNPTNTPTPGATSTIPTSTLTPTSGPTPTPSGSGCQGKKVAINLLVDVSGSMLFGNKLPRLRDALLDLDNFLTPTNVVGIQIFSDPNYLITPFSTSGAKEILPFGFYNKTNYQTQVNGISIPSIYPQTHMRDGFILARDKIIPAQQRSEFAGYRWFLILLSDGLPNDILVPGPGPDNSQNPVDLIPQFRTLGVKIFVIGLDLNALGAQYSNVTESILRSLVDDPGDLKLSPSATELEEKYREIIGNIC